MKLHDFGWNQFFSSAFYGCAGAEDLPGRVTAVQRGLYAVSTEHSEIEAEASGRLHHTATGPQDWPAVGDWVVLRAGTNLIDAVLPRQTCFSRKQAGDVTAEQVLAANIDTVLVVSGLDQDFNLRRIERVLLLAAESGAAAVVVLNKADLLSNLGEPVEAVERIAPGTPVVALSALTGEGVDALTPHLAPGRTAALIGSSGAGKSTLLNRLYGSEIQRVQAVREHDSRGRHTTTHRELIRMPAGWLLVDMPGLREWQLWAGEERLDEVFADIATLAGACRFRDCTHQGEPGCAVQHAVEAGTLEAERLESHSKMRREVAYLERKQDSRAALDEKRRLKRLFRVYRKVPNRW